MKVQKTDMFGGNKVFIRSKQHHKGHELFGWNTEKDEPEKFIKVVFDNRKITHKKDSRQIVCVLDCHLEFSMPHEWKNYLSYHTDFTVKGIAKCSPEDDFDFDKGRLIAQSLAENEAYKVGENMIAHIHDEMSCFANASVAQISILQKYAEHNTKFIEDIVTGKYTPKKK